MRWNLSDTILVNFNLNLTSSLPIFRLTNAILRITTRQCRAVATALHLCNYGLAKLLDTSELRHAQPRSSGASLRPRPTPLKCQQPNRNGQKRAEAALRMAMITFTPVGEYLQKRRLD